MSLRIARSKALNTIPERKLISALRKTVSLCEICSKNNAKLDGACGQCRTINTALNRYKETNIPVDFWRLDVASFEGDKVLLERYNQITKDLDRSYGDGICICFAGSHGIGKTYIATSILKRAVEKGYQALYTTLSDIVDVSIHGPSEEKYAIRRELLMVDFLVIDEFDPRWMPAGATADLFGRKMEEVFRKRSENNLPLFMCTNSPSVIDSFQGPIKKSIDSLMNFTEFVTVVGQDYRKTKKRSK